MIKQEQTNDLIHTYSDNGYYILQNETGIKYVEAYDIMPCKYTYSETDELIIKDMIQQEDKI